MLSGSLPARVPMSALLSGDRSDGPRWSYRSNGTHGSDGPYRDHGTHGSDGSNRPYGSDGPHRSDRSNRSYGRNGSCWPYGSDGPYRNYRSNRPHRSNRCRRRRFHTGVDFCIFHAASKRYGRRCADF